MLERRRLSEWRKMTARGWRRAGMGVKTPVLSHHGLCRDILVIFISCPNQ